MKILIGGKKEQKARSLAAAPTTAVPDEGGLQRALEEELPLSCPSLRLIHVTLFSPAFAELLSCENRVGRRSDMQKNYHQKEWRSNLVSGANVKMCPEKEPNEKR